MTFDSVDGNKSKTVRKSIYIDHIFNTNLTFFTVIHLDLVIYEHYTRGALKSRALN